MLISYVTHGATRQDAFNCCPSGFSSGDLSTYWGEFSWVDAEQQLLAFDGKVSIPAAQYHLSLVNRVDPGSHESCRRQTEKREVGGTPFGGEEGLWSSPQGS